MQLARETNQHVLHGCETLCDNPIMFEKPIPNVGVCDPPGNCDSETVLYQGITYNYSRTRLIEHLLELFEIQYITTYICDAWVRCRPERWQVDVQSSDGKVLRFYKRFDDLGTQESGTSCNKNLCLWHIAGLMSMCHTQELLKYWRTLVLVNGSSLGVMFDALNLAGFECD